MVQDFKKWRNNRPASKFSKVKRWRTNPAGAFVRLLEFAYFGRPLINFFVSKHINIEPIIHLSNSFNMTESNENLNYLRNVRVDLRANFIQLDTGHIFNSGMTPNEVYSGEYWNQLRDIRKSKDSQLLPGIFYPIANQKYFYHFLLEELPEIISANRSIEDIKFISSEGQPRFVLELCKLAGIDIHIFENSIQRCENLIIPSYLRENSTWSLEQLRTLKTDTHVNVSYPRKILLLRKGKARSDSIFEESLSNFVSPFDFTVIDPDYYSSSEQINIFSCATDIIAIHGAALSNLAFSNSSCKVFEIFNHPYRTYFFRDLAKNNGNSYTSSELDSVFAELDNWLKNS